MPACRYLKCKTKHITFKSLRNRQTISPVGTLNSELSEGQFIAVSEFSVGWADDPESSGDTLSQELLQNDDLPPFYSAKNDNNSTEKPSNSNRSGQRIRDQVLILSFDLVISATKTTANAASTKLSSVVKRTAEQLNSSSEEFPLYDFKIYDISVQCPDGFTHAKKYHGTCGKDTLNAIISLDLYIFVFVVT